MLCVSAFANTLLARAVGRAAIFNGTESWAKQMDVGFVYVLQCTEGRWYVGHTTDIYRRIAQHWLGTGALWTKKYKPIRIVSCVEGSPALEKATFAAYAIEKKFQNVRGAGFCKIVMKEPEFIKKARDYSAWKASEAHDPEEALLELDDGEARGPSE